jgi:hypothetical protein
VDQERIFAGSDFPYGPRRDHKKIRPQKKLIPEKFPKSRSITSRVMPKAMDPHLKQRADKWARHHSGTYGVNHVVVPLHELPTIYSSSSDA